MAHIRKRDDNVSWQWKASIRIFHVDMRSLRKRKRAQKKDSNLLCNDNKIYNVIFYGNFMGLWARESLNFAIAHKINSSMLLSLLIVKPNNDHKMKFMCVEMHFRCEIEWVGTPLCAAEREEELLKFSLIIQHGDISSKSRRENSNFLVNFSINLKITKITNKNYRKYQVSTPWNKFHLKNFKIQPHPILHKKSLQILSFSLPLWAYLQELIEFVRILFIHPSFLVQKGAETCKLNRFFVLGKRQSSSVCLHEPLYKWNWIFHSSVVEY